MRLNISIYVYCGKPGKSDSGQDTFCPGCGTIVTNQNQGIRSEHLNLDAEKGIVKNAENLIYRYFTLTFLVNKLKPVKKLVDTNHEIFGD